MNFIITAEIMGRESRRGFPNSIHLTDDLWMHSKVTSGNVKDPVITGTGAMCERGCV
jgi:hypothetical protein